MTPHPAAVPEPPLCEAERLQRFYETLLDISLQHERQADGTRVRLPHGHGRCREDFAAPCPAGAD